MWQRSMAVGFLLVALVLGLRGGVPDEPKEQTDRIARLEEKLADLQSRFDELAKSTDDLLWYQKVGDVAEIDKVTITGPPSPKAKAIYGIAPERRPLKIYAYVFMPRRLEPSSRHPLLILPHGGVNADFTTYHAHIIREMMARGYVVVAPEYRGSTGYGEDLMNAIDYGGLEVDDCVAARDWAVENLPCVDGKHVAMVGWSHGGLISLMAVFRFPDKFQACYAGVPVSDLLARMAYVGDDYRAIFSAPNHIGKSAEDAVDEYRKRSPAWNAEKLQTPLLVHTTTNDQDVNVVEVEHLIQALKAAGKSFEYKIYQDAPGAHSFNRIDTTLARESRREIYEFLDRYLKHR